MEGGRIPYGVFRGFRGFRGFALLGLASSCLRAAIQRNLNRLLVILNFLILDRRVDAGIPSSAAAPAGP